MEVLASWLQAVNHDKAFHANLCKAYRTMKVIIRLNINWRAGRGRWRDYNCDERRGHQLQTHQWTEWCNGGSLSWERGRRRTQRSWWLWDADQRDPTQDEDPWWCGRCKCRRKPREIWKSGWVPSKLLHQVWNEENARLISNWVVRAEGYRRARHVQDAVNSSNLLKKPRT